MPVAKPPYELPTVAEVRARPGALVAASTFSGAGGSCLGLRMAGFRVAFASEFDAAARETYLANFPDVPLDARDVREVAGGDVREVAGDLDLLEGSPPCQPFSTSGRRGLMNDARDCFPEYMRLLRELRPRAFVVENVKGLVSGRAKGYYLHIMRGLRESGYDAEARLLDAQWLGVPQHRERVLIVGFRDEGDAGRFCWPAPLPYRYVVSDVLPEVTDVGTNTSHDTYAERGRDPVSTLRPASSLASPTITATGIDKGAGLVVSPTSRPPWASDGTAVDPETGARLDVPARVAGLRALTLAEIRLLCAFPPDFELAGRHEARRKQLGNAVPPRMAAAVAREVARVLERR